MPNKKNANATLLFGRMIQKLQIEIGQNVEKGEVIATKSNPQFIQLQEEYLIIKSRIEYAVQELERQQDLNESSADAKKNLQSASAEVNTLRSREASLQQQIQMMGIDPNSLSAATLKSSLIVKSPINGTISICQNR